MKFVCCLSFDTILCLLLLLIVVHNQWMVVDCKEFYEANATMKHSAFPSTTMSQPWTRQEQDGSHQDVHQGLRRCGFGHIN